jgi:queuine tRNA-ribosyltransferase
MQKLYPNFDFTITQRDTSSKARLGRITTPHGVVETPAFIFCGTKAAIKIASPMQMRAAKTQIILSNTYHLMLQPGSALIQKMGGLHKFTGWDGPMLTDSGGFQVFSMAYGGIADEIKGRRTHDRPNTVLKISEEGVKFRSYLDGAEHFLTPERAIDIQRELGPDLVVMFDECTPYHATKDYTQKSLLMTHRWGERGLKHFHATTDGRQALYGVSQGCIYPDLRRQAADWLNGQDFFAHAIGGSFGKDKQELLDTFQAGREPLRDDKPVHALGIGDVDDIWHLTGMGIDTFDCVSPTRIARHGWALTRYAKSFRLNLMNARFRDDPTPLDETVPSEASGYSRAYIHHLLKAKEILGLQLLALHNIAFMNQMLQAVRDSIRENRYEQTKREWLGASV